MSNFNIPGEKISMKIISTVKVLENGCVQLPKEMMEHLLLKTGDSIKIEWERQPIREKCFQVREDNEEEMFNEGFYCILERFFENCHIPLESVQILESDGTMTLTTSDHLVSSLGAEVVSCLMLQEVDFERLADDLADCINDIYEDECLQNT